MAATPNLNLTLTDPSSWSTVVSKDWLNALMGTNPGSNMHKIDEAIATLQSGKADLIDGVVPAAQIPSDVHDILAGSMSADLSSFTPSGASEACTPKSGRLYLDLAKKIFYWWNGTAYTPAASYLALGTEEGTACRGDHGEKAYNHISSQSNPHNVTAQQIGLGSVDNTADLDKPVSKAVQTALDTLEARIGDVATLLDTINGEVV